MFHSLASSSSGNLYTVSDGGTSLILEAGLPFPKLQKALKYNLTGYAGCFITHQHADHAQAAQELARRGMDIYCHPDTAKALGIEAEATAMLPGCVQRIGSLLVQAIETRHDVPSVGYLIYSIQSREKLLVALDTCYLPNRFEGLTEIAVECNFSMAALTESSIPGALKRRIMETHMSVETFIGMLEANDISRVNKIYLLHMSNDRGDAELFKTMVQEATGKPTEVCK